MPGAEPPLPPDVHLNQMLPPAGEAPPPVKAEEADGKVAPEKPALEGDVFKIKLDRERYVYDVITGHFLEKTAEPLVFLPPDQCGVFALLDYEVKAVDVKTSLRPQELTYRITLNTTGRAGLHAYWPTGQCPSRPPGRCAGQHVLLH